MKRVAFFGLGAMGRPMAVNLSRKFEVVAFDAKPEVRRTTLTMASSIRAAASEADAIVTALPAETDVEAVLMKEALLVARPGTLLIDCSTVSPNFAARLEKAASDKACFAIDAPMSGGVAAATAGTLTFMVGGSEEAVVMARPILEAMGSKVKRVGPSGSGCAAKLCNNMMLASQMIAVAEGLHLAEELGLDVDAAYDLFSTSTSRCWSLNDYPPVAGLGSKTSPANHDFKPGFSASLMLKDLDIAMAAAHDLKAYVPLGSKATDLYRKMCQTHAHKDFSAIIQLLRDSRDTTPPT